MKKILSLIFITGFSLAVFAQSNVRGGMPAARRRRRRDRMNAQLIGNAL